MDQEGFLLANIGEVEEGRRYIVCGTPLEPDLKDDQVVEKLKNELKQFTETIVGMQSMQSLQNLSANAAPKT
jgi:hypothetical protein